MLLRRLARMMLAGIFISGGAEAFRHPHARAELAESVATPLARVIPLPLPEDPVQLVRFDAAVKVGAGVCLAAGRLPRLSSLVLAASLVPTTVAGHRFWEHEEPQRTQQQTQLLKNLAILGGLVLSAVDTGGAPSLGWRARRAARGAAGSAAASYVAARRLLPVS